MGQPEVDYNPPTFTTQSLVWSDQANVMAGLSNSSAGLTIAFNYPFDQIGKKYENARALFQRLTGEGAEEMQQIAQAIYAAGQRYSDTEQANTEQANTAQANTAQANSVGYSLYGGLY